MSPVYSTANLEWHRMSEQIPQNEEIAKPTNQFSFEQLSEKQENLMNLIETIRKNFQNYLTSPSSVKAPLALKHKINHLELLRNLISLVEETKQYLACKDTEKKAKELIQKTSTFLRKEEKKEPLIFNKELLPFFQERMIALLNDKISLLKNNLSKSEIKEALTESEFVSKICIELENTSQYQELKALMSQLIS